MSHLSMGWKSIELAIELSHRYIEQTQVLVVVNTKSNSLPSYNYPYHSILTDFFSDQEYSDILTGFRNCARYVEGIVGEEAFLEKLSEGFGYTFNTRTIVYSGVGNTPGRASNLIVPALCELRN